MIDRLKSLSWKWKLALTLPPVLLLFYIGVQLIVNDKPANPPTHTILDWPDDGSEALARAACYDCHSHLTQWPWYTLIWPMSATIEEDVKKGREVLNFSKMADSCCTREQIERMAQTVNSGTMPLTYYVPLHPNARLNSQERGLLVHALLDIMQQYCTDCE